MWKILLLTQTRCSALALDIWNNCLSLHNYFSRILRCVVFNSRSIVFTLVIKIRFKCYRCFWHWAGAAIDLLQKTLHHFGIFLYTIYHCWDHTKSRFFLLCPSILTIFLLVFYTHVVHGHTAQVEAKSFPSECAQ